MSINRTDKKEIIHYHRSYRKLANKNKLYILLEFLILACLFDILILFFYPQITYFANYFARLALVSFFGDMEIVTRPYLFKDFFMISLAGKYPAFSLARITALTSLLTILLLPWIRKIPKPISFWIILVSFINLISSLFFIFFADKFPYSLDIFSELYIGTEIGMWLLIPIILTMAFIPLPSSIITKALVVIFTLAYSIIFGCVRYVIFLYVLKEFSYLFMAMLFFVFGPLMDSVYIVGIYSFYVSTLAKKVKGDLKVWKWLY